VSFAQKGIDPVVQVLTFIMLMLGVLANNLTIRVFTVTIVLLIISTEWHRIETEKTEYRKHCEV